MMACRRLVRKWAGVDGMPTFGKLLEFEEDMKVFGGFESYMLKCTRAEPGTPPYTVSILHMSPACAGPTAAVRAAEIGRLHRFMRDEGFTVKREDGLAGWDLTDVLILGTDKGHADGVYDMLDILGRGAGLVQGWNVLVYGMDGKPPHDLVPGDGPLLTGPNFGFDAVCMLHAHMRMRGSLQFWAGQLAYMSDQIEYDSTQIINASQRMKPVNDNDGLSNKGEILVSVLRNAGVRESDVEMFSRAVILVRTVRNVLVHLMSSTQKSNVQFGIVSERLNDLYVSAERHGRSDLFLGWRTPVGNTVSMLATFMPFYVRLALLIDRWLSYCKTYSESSPVGGRSGTGRAHASHQTEKTEI